jgi:phosphoribosyl 1,2-cyclic phosphodiesterase
MSAAAGLPSRNRRCGAPRDYRRAPGGQRVPAAAPEKLGRARGCMRTAPWINVGAIVAGSETGRMQVKFWGTRGSSPVSGPLYLEFGGNTPCLQVSLASTQEIVILDSGTGIRELGLHLLEAAQSAPPPLLHLFLTHAHWDHIQGFPFFGPAYSPKFVLHIYCTKDARAFLDGQMRPPYFPVGLDMMRAAITFHAIDRGMPITIGDATITNIPLPHPQGSTAFRVQENGRAFVLSTDTEHQPGKVNQDLVEISRAADAIIYDAQYTPSEYDDGKQGWGHSTFAEGVKVARAAGVKQLILFSHDPLHTDEDLRRIEREARQQLPGTVSARQGQVLTL